MEIKDMNLEQIQERKGSIQKELQDENITLETVESLEAEVDALNKRKKEIEDVIQERKALESKIVNSNDLTILERKEDKVEEMTVAYNTESPEFRSAYFKKLAGEQLTEIEERAYTHTTENYGGALPAETLNEIWSNIHAEHSILGDITTYRTGTVLELTVHTAIADGDAKTVSEGVANDDEQNTFVKVTLSGKDFSKHVEISYALGRMTSGALEDYLIQELGQQMGEALANDVIAQIKADTLTANKVDSAANNVVDWKDLNGLFGLIKGGGQKVVYVNNTTLYNYLTAMTDSNKRPIFQPNAQDGAQGRLLGAQVKIEESLADKEILVGNPKKVVGNFIQDIMIEDDKEIKRHVEIYAAYARFECKLTNNQSFALLTVKTGA